MKKNALTALCLAFATNAMALNMPKSVIAAPRAPVVAKLNFGQRIAGGLLLAGLINMAGCQTYYGANYVYGDWKSEPGPRTPVTPYRASDYSPSTQPAGYCDHGRDCR